ncbi:MAG: sugar nucleotide-binding protein, partial [Verrucomicrobiota bacterium]
SESNKTRCLLANTALPSLVAEVCAEHSLTWGHLSTGCIYSGTRPDGSGFTEKDPPNFTFRQDNCSFYSGTKALAEEILKEYDNVYIWRFRRPFNSHPNPRNYLNKVLSYEKQLETENSITQVDEMIHACQHYLTKQLPTGIYNITNPGIIKTSELIELIQKNKISDQAYAFYSSAAEFYADAGRTPRSECILDSSKIMSHGIPLTEIHEALDRALRQWHH